MGGYIGRMVVETLQHSPQCQCQAVDKAKPSEMWCWMSDEKFFS